MKLWQGWSGSSCGKTGVGVAVGQGWPRSSCGKTGPGLGVAVEAGLGVAVARLV